MSDENETQVTYLLLQGFWNLHSFNMFFFIIFLIIFLSTLIGNLLIIVLVSTSQPLHAPMYFFLCHLSVSDIILSLNIAPILLCTLLGGAQRMSFRGCIVQFSVFSAITIIECLLLLVMSYDRYLAICYPLRYASVMDFKTCIHLAAWSWFLGYSVHLCGFVPITTLRFCHNKLIIDHFYCDLSPLQRLACSDTSLVMLIVFVFAIPVFVLPCCLIIMSYIYIFITILRIPSTTGKRKAFSTCSSHLIVVATFYGTLITKYMLPYWGHLLLIDKVISLLHTVLTPLFNPVIYTLRNKDIKKAARTMCRKYCI
ncbi:olfactory receptor 11L1-like [Xenopus laevis]|uniref:Olfactory receptor n=2 Tax=Xenopus laevis TaxID=8355 RepID=A0A974H2X6_XENLA|nr:olfactory receptor 11L1-like [Xenopus laevis]OCT62913.1 hypothetical protein XELAEV_18044005mg [Xenopus laevis]